MHEMLIEASKEIETELIETGRPLHQHPELSFTERETSKFIVKKLEDAIGN